MACSPNTNQPMANHKMGEGELKRLRIEVLTHDMPKVGIKTTANSGFIVLFKHENICFSI